MSGEQLSDNKYNKSTKLDPKNSRVNINHLLSKIRDEKKRKKKENYMFFGLAVGVLAVTGIIASL